MTAYEGMRGFELNVTVLGVESLAGVTGPKLHVVEPDGTRSVWTPEVLVEEGLFRYTHPGPLKAGEYTVQPSFTLGDFSGPWGEFFFRVEESHALSVTG